MQAGINNTWKNISIQIVINRMVFLFHKDANNFNNTFEPIGVSICALKRNFKKIKIYTQTYVEINDVTTNQNLINS